MSGEHLRADGKTGPPVLIGSTPVGLAIFLCFVQLLCLGCLAGTCLAMAFINPEENGTTTQDLSPSLVVLALLSVFVGLLSFRDLRKTCGLLRVGPQGVTWEIQHSIFKRAVFPVIAETLLIFPIIFIFVLHSRGVEFSHLINTLPGNYVDLVTYHIILVVVNLVTGIFIVPYVHFSLTLGLFGKEDRTIGYMFTKLCAVLFALSTLILDVALIYMVAKLRTNSGAVTFTVFYVLTSIPVTRFMIMFIFRGSQLYTQKWLIALRAAVTLHLGVGYLAGWVMLLMIVLEGSGADGFWVSVQNLTSIRSSIVYLHFAMYLILIATVSYRVFLAKLRRRGRAAKILVAVTGEAIPEEALARHERAVHKKDKDGKMVGAFVAIERVISGDYGSNDSQNSHGTIEQV